MITSTSNQKVKRLVNLRKKRKCRDDENVFLTEGIRMFREVPVQRLKEVYVSESFYRKEKREIERILSNRGKELSDGRQVGSDSVQGGLGNGKISSGSRIVLEVLSDTVFDYVSDTRTPQGILCVVEQRNVNFEEAAGGECPHIIVLEHLQDPGNLGTILRAAEGAGVTGVVMDRECVDIYNPKTIRSTMGSVYRMPFCYVPDLGIAVRKLRDRGIHVYAAHLDGKRNYDEEDYRNPCAFLIGNEGNGLSEEIAAEADTYIQIPMAGQVESLNAAVAASVLMFEVARQRRQK